jgi:hypothetical protein
MGRVPSAEDAGRFLLALWRSADAWGTPGAGSLPPGPGWLLPAARLAPAFLLAALASGLGRVYLVLRREVDGTPYSMVYERR